MRIEAFIPERRRASAAAALSDAIAAGAADRPSSRGRSSSGVVDAWNTSLRATVTVSERSGLPSMNTTAVIILVMLAIDRWLPEFSSQRIWFVSGSCTIAAAARRIGHHVAARVHLVAWQRRSRHLAGHRKRAARAEPRPPVERRVGA
jgi:hypothetical protein